MYSFATCAKFCLKKVKLCGIIFLRSTRTISVGSNVMIAASDINFNPTNAGCKRLLYSSNKTSVATVTSQGKVTGIKAGTATITISSHNGKTTTITVTVT